MNEKNLALSFYFAFSMAFALTFVPSGLAAIVSFILFIGVLIGSYITRSKQESSSFAYNHLTFVISSLWAATTLSVFTIIVASAYMFASGVNYEAFTPCAEAMASRGAEYLKNAGFQEYSEMTEPCITPFIGQNFKLLVTTSLIAALPVILYIIYRLIKGVSLATKDGKLTNPRSWF